MPENDFVQPTKKKQRKATAPDVDTLPNQREGVQDAFPDPRTYLVTPEAKEQRIEAAKASAIARRGKTEEKMAVRLEKFVDSIQDGDIVDASMKEKLLAVGILYDKLYRHDNATRGVQAVQINISAPPGEQPLNLDVKPIEPKP